MSMSSPVGRSIGTHVFHQKLAVNKAWVVNNYDPSAFACIHKAHRSETMSNVMIAYPL